MNAVLVVDRRFSKAEIDPMLYGSFIEHVGRAVYGGIFEPEHPASDENGFRQDVLELVRELGVTVVRYPGGNFVSAFKWEDSVGPVEKRPVRLDPAWRSREPNLVGVNEFSRWSGKAGVQIMMAVNLGTRGVEEALNLVEYCNHPGGSYWSDLRSEHGSPEPHSIRYWCLGNEMDGPWQVGQKTAVEYGRIAACTAKAVRYFDKTLKLTVCGSSISTLPTFPEWERTVLDESYEDIDFISLHMYLGDFKKDLQSFLAVSVSMDRYIETVIHTCDYVKAQKRSRKTINLSFDEWNVWYHTVESDKQLMNDTRWVIGPPLLEDVYTFADALVVGMMLNSLMRHADRVKIACLAQLVNAIAPIMTENGGPAWRQTIFYPFRYASRYGRGSVLDIRLDCPAYTDEKYGEVPYLDVCVVANGESGELSFFIISRNRTESVHLDCMLSGYEGYSLAHHFIMVSDDVNAVNSKDHPDTVTVTEVRGFVFEKGKVSGDIAPLSWNCIVLKAR